MFPNNNSTGATSDFSIDDFYFHDYLFEGTNWEPSNSTAQNTGFEQLASLSTAELEQLCMAPDLGSQMDTVIDSNGFDMNDIYQSGAFGLQLEYLPEYTEESVADPPTDLFSLPPAQLHFDFPATFVGPMPTSAEVPAFTWDPLPLPSMTCLDTGNNLSDPYDQPLSVPTLAEEWPFPTSVDDCEAQVTDQPSPTDDATVWQHPHMPQDYDASLNPQSDASVEDTTLPVRWAEPSSGPQRYPRSVKRKGKEVAKVGGKQKPRMILSYRDACRRFCDAMAETCIDESTGKVTNPEKAYTKAADFAKEDLCLSSRNDSEHTNQFVEQYLTSILHELYPPPLKNRGTRGMLERVVGKLEDELVEANGSSALRTTVSKAVVPEKMGMSEEQIRCRERTAGIRVALERMSQFFRVPYPKFTGWTRQRVIFFAILYIKFGASVFDDEFIVLKSQH